MKLTTGWRHRVSFALGVGAVLVLAGPASAKKVAVLELFSSQGCSACPPADVLLGKLSQDKSVIALTMPIDYWDYLGWKDTLADQRFTLRQKAYSRMRGDRDVYTPQMVINGVTQVIGSDVAGVERGIIESGEKADVMSVPVVLDVSEQQVRVSVDAATTDASQGEVWLCAVSREISIAVGRGENSGKALTYHNVVRTWLKVGDWAGTKSNWVIPLESVAREGADAAVVYLQQGSQDAPGHMLGAAYIELERPED